MRITVGISGRLLQSTDEGRTWLVSTRTVPRVTEPTLQGVVRSTGPTIPAGWELSHVHVGSEGVGFAAGWQPVTGEPGRDSTARFWRTRDDGITWHNIEPEFGFWGRMRAWPSWPPEKVDSIVLLAGGLLAFAWEDPWLHEGPNSHMVLSADGGARWRYARMPDGCVELALGPGPLRAFSGGRFVTRSATGSLRRTPIGQEWRLPPGYWPIPLPLRQVHFVSESEAFALCVTWPRDEPGKTPEDLPPPLIGLARTDDGGRRWKVRSTWEGPRSIDLNRRHEVTLEVR